MDWDEYFLNLCKSISLKSKDPSTKVGALIVGPNKEIRSTGWNGFARGIVDSKERYESRPLKYDLVVHAELNAICNAARVGTPLDGCTLYVFPLYVCNDCAKAVIQVGIKEIVMVSSERNKQIWINKMELSRIMFDEANVTYRILEITEKMW